MLFQAFEYNIEFRLELQIKKKPSCILETFLHDGYVQLASGF